MRDSLAAARISGWREVDEKKECFVMDALPPALAFPEIGLSRFAGLADIFLHFVDGDVVSKLINSFTLEDLTLGFRDKKKGTIRKMKVTPKLIYKILAIHIRIIGLQEKPNEATHNDKPLRKALLKCMVHFRDLRCPGIDYLEKLTAIMLFEEVWEEVLSQNFQSSLSRLGQFVAGDEKLFHFTGKRRCSAC